MKPSLLENNKPGAPDSAVVFVMPPFDEFMGVELRQTASEFYLAGILRAPYRHVRYKTMYQVEKKDPPVKMFVDIKEEAPDDEEDLVHPQHRVQIGINVEGEYKPLPFFCVFNGEHLRLKFNKDEFDKVKTETWKDLKMGEVEIGRWCRDVTMLCLLVTNMKQFEQHDVVHGPKIQKAREKKGLPPLNRTILIRLHSSFRNILNAGGGSGIERRPHWRRGHLRHLQSGAIVPVSPCMVNWRGEAVEPKEYRIKPDKGDVDVAEH